MPDINDDASPIRTITAKVEFYRWQESDERKRAAETLASAERSRAKAEAWSRVADILLAHEAAE